MWLTFYTWKLVFQPKDTQHTHRGGQLQDLSENCSQTSYFFAQRVNFSDGFFLKCLVFGSDARKKTRCTFSYGWGVLHACSSAASAFILRGSFSVLKGRVEGLWNLKAGRWFPLPAVHSQVWVVNWGSWEEWLENMVRMGSVWSGLACP